MEYFVSQSEIYRRKKAFTVLIISILIGIVFASWIFNLHIYWWSVLVIVIIVFSVFCLTWLFLVSLRKVRLVINEKYIKRIVDCDIQVYSFCKNKSDENKKKIERRNKRNIFVVKG